MIEAIESLMPFVIGVVLYLVAVMVLSRLDERKTRLLASLEPKGSAAGPKANKHIVDNRDVFIVYGRDSHNYAAMCDFLRSLDLKPLAWSTAKLRAAKRTRRASPYIGDILDVLFGDAQAVIVLLTGDDEARLRPDLLRPDDGEHERQLWPQARQNVLFEAGMALGRADDRTIIVRIGDTRPFSDVSGRHEVRLGNDAEKRLELVDMLENLGCGVDREGGEWVKAGEFHVPHSVEGIGQPETADAGEPVGKAFTLDLERIKASWHVFVDTLRLQGPKGNLDAVLRAAAEPVAYEDGVLTLAFSHAFHLRSTEESAYLVESAASEFYDTPMRLRLKLK